METMRKPLQGTINIIRFNWHFYLLAAAIILIAFISSCFLNTGYRFYLSIVCIVIASTTLISLFVSFYIYDVSDLYQLNWLDKINIQPGSQLININAGFDETSELLSIKYPSAQLQVFDFYDPEKHTEISIKRARKAYPPYKNTISIKTNYLPADNNAAHNILVTFAAHEIRNDEERVFFFKELSRVLNEEGKIVITEHTRNLQNFVAYNIGFFHFLSRSAWLQTFRKSNLIIAAEIKTTPFITSFILTKNGIAP